ncbi:hypothetical protein KSX_70160 [Ktedonospora formicarum]|uniref:Uncharacterized protein n=1 Tax=Ktedonospora formicarum TaxID=2778364 RepID=A0A8J3MWN8_9CHLR|nr:hypothetical protein KSX_70160 [Ktedonospora formicarum]
MRSLRRGSLPAIISHDDVWQNTLSPYTVVLWLLRVMAWDKKAREHHSCLSQPCGLSGDVPRTNAHEKTINVLDKKSPDVSQPGRGNAEREVLLAHVHACLYTDRNTFDADEAEYDPLKDFFPGGTTHTIC